MQDKHFALLVFCRGILVPTYIQYTRTVTDREKEIEDCQSFVAAPFLSLKASFERYMSINGIRQPSVSSKLLYPIAVIALRTFRLLSDETACTDPATPHGTPNPSYSSYDLVYMEDESKLCSMLAYCMTLDREAQKRNGIANMGDILLASICRWMHDLTAFYFVNEGDFQLKLEILPDEVKRNTVAMELASTSSAWVIGKKRAKRGYMTHSAAMGRMLSLLIATFEAGQNIGIPLAGTFVGAESTAPGGADYSDGADLWDHVDDVNDVVDDDGGVAYSDLIAQDLEEIVQVSKIVSILYDCYAMMLMMRMSILT